MELPIDLRSDTVTRPSPAMRQAMADAEVGDDVAREDPTINRLEELCAELYGMEASLFTPSGSMANQVAIKTWTQAGDEMIVDLNAHCYNLESAAIAALSGVQVAPVDGRRGIMTPEQVEARIRPKNVHHGPTALIAIENTHNRGGGSIYPVETVVGIGEVARRHGIRLHLDGARLLNACVEKRVRPTDYTRHCDSATLCFSKGLGCPVGSIVAGPRDFIERARRWRKVFGGGMRQAGILAAAAIYALQHNVERLAEDHANARLLAQGLAEIDTLDLDPGEVETNMVFFDCSRTGMTAAALKHTMAKAGVLMYDTAPHRIRLVTHLDVTREQVLDAVAIFKRVLMSA
ncbi:MAG TPA: low-specificity L-threonine aldolase [Planctomycetota bacterium]|nr:low-specificity L-threonine aldolase [Planctomycetota bacterium]HRR78752.1 low-specificity L-threonine aldolase [Planctomycetota bacterium]HRT95235.1 low-specificity L-threonine aldolase [Planctomycetota bacterium]